MLDLVPSYLSQMEQLNRSDMLRAERHLSYYSAGLEFLSCCDDALHLSQMLWYFGESMLWSYTSVDIRTTVSQAQDFTASASKGEIHPSSPRGMIFSLPEPPFVRAKPLGFTCRLEVCRASTPLEFTMGRGVETYYQGQKMLS